MSARLLASGLGVLAALALPVGGVVAAELPAATKAVLAALKLDASVLGNVDEEAAIPPGWREKARQEGPLQVIGSWDPAQFERMTRPFRERYPDVPINYVRGGTYDREVKTLMGYKAGRFVADILTSPGEKWVEFDQAGGLEDMRVLPNFKRLDPIMRDANGKWIGERLTYRCLAYNKTRVKKEELPKTWDELITNTRLHNGRVGIINLPSLWLSMLWTSKGPDWTRQFMADLFAKVKPQLRKEGANAIVGLAAVGEVDVAVAAADYRVQQAIEKGAPLGFHCPEPVPAAVSLIIVLKDNPHKFASLMFMNWFISLEGQASQFTANHSIAIRSELNQRKEFNYFADEVAGKSLAVRDEGTLPDFFPTLLAYYDPLWKRSGGPGKEASESESQESGLDELTGKLTEVDRGGRFVKLDVGGEIREVSIAARRTAITIDGKAGERTGLKAGMACKVASPRAGGSASLVACGAAGK